MRTNAQGQHGHGYGQQGHGYLELTFENGAVVVRISASKNVSVTKKGSIIIKDKKPKQ